MSKYTNTQIAGNWDLWTQYVNASGAQSREQWDALTIDERLAIISECGFGDEEAE
jgi:hypothetical protein